MKRVLCVFSWLGRGGAEGMCMNIFRNLNRDRVQFDFVRHGTAEGDYEAEIRALGGKIYTAPLYRIYNHFQYCKWWRDFFTEHPEYEIIHGHYYTVSAVYLKIARSFGRVAVAHSHNTHQADLIKLFFSKQVEGVADYQLACGRQAGEWMFPNSSFQVLPNAIDTQAFRYDAQVRQQKRRELGLENAFIAGVVANFTSPKNPLGIVELAEYAGKKIPNFRLLWAGDGPMRHTIEREIRKKGLQEQIILMGMRGDVPQLLQAMDVLLQPSFHEGLPVSLIEAQAAGLPVLCSESITREADVTGLCRFLPLEDWEAWVEAMAETDPAQRVDTQEKMVQGGYDVLSNTRWLEEFYENARQSLMSR